ncbi:MAG: hypothetical protein KGJ13_11155, partial [Patescibacteria group bacterium]|nr:hypothetical protein [Patescibacteria group bacterium]
MPFTHYTLLSRRGDYLLVLPPIKTMLFKLSRFKKTPDGIFGYLTFDDQSLVTLENEGLCIPAGTYDLTVSYSPHLEEPTPLLLNVPGRTEIRIHSANVQTQLKGCIAVGIG